jgi:putative inorganic carbon (HCO3(-)) transporter
MRTLFVLVIVAVGAAFSLRGAFYIMLFYLWNAYFRPEAWAWSDLVASLHLSLFLGVALITATIFSRERRQSGRPPLLFLLFAAQCTVATALSPTGADLWSFTTEMLTLLVICYAMVVLVNSEERLRLTLLVVAGSLSFEGAREGLVQLVTSPGARNANSWVMLGDNNGVAVGMLMILPIVIVLARTATTRAERIAGWTVAVGVLFRALSTYSRGGFLAATALGLHYVLRSRRRVPSFLVAILLAFAVAQVMPDRFWDRISTIRGAEDTSEASRLYFWQLGIAMGNDYPVFGVGVNGFPQMFNRYDTSRGRYGSNRDVHDTWIALLADLGYPGLLIFLALMGSVLLNARHLRQLAASQPAFARLSEYATAMEGQILVFAVGGTFITLQYKEPIWHIFALSVALARMVDHRLGVTKNADALLSPPASLASETP